MSRQQRFGSTHIAQKHMAQTHTEQTALKEDMLRAKIATERARLQRLREDLPEPKTHYVRFEDLRPPTPEEQDRFYARLEAAIKEIESRAARKKRDWYLSMIDKAPG